MRHILALLALISLLGFATPSQALSVEETIYAELLTRKNAAHIKVGAQSLFNKNITNVELVDIAAEALALSLDGKITLKIDDQAWITKALGASKNLRYYDFLTTIIDSDVHGKLIKYSKKARGALETKGGGTFVKGKINLRDLAKKISQDKKKITSNATEDDFLDVYSGDTLDQVLDALGAPNRVSVVFGTATRAWVGTVRYSMLSLKFKNLGTLNFEFGKEIGQWIVAESLPKNG